jgi:hypothetical protein
MRIWTLGIILVSACFGDPAINPNPPEWKGNDVAFSSHGLKGWYLVGDALRASDDQMSFTITAPDNASVVDAYVGSLPPVRMTEQADGTFALDISIASLPTGDYDILFSKNGHDTAFGKVTFHRSAAYYVLVSTDYDFSDCGNGSLMYMDKLHADHPGMVITHFWAPYTYTDPDISYVRRDELTAWIKNQRDTFQDEIGLHIHPYCNFVTASGLTCVTDQSTVYAADTSGYTIKLGAYDVTKMSQLLQYAATVFDQRGLGTPHTFRAGGWTAEASTMQALDQNGYVADTSALNWQRIEEWSRYELYRWNMANWSTIGDTSQPYYPSATDPQASVTGANLAMLEVPDNGVMIDYVTLDEMNGIFDANYEGKALAKPKTLMMGFHPAMQFSADEYGRVDGFLKYADQHLAEAGTGPVVYVSLSTVTKVDFSAP